MSYSYTVWIMNLRTKFGWNWSSGSGEAYFQMFSTFSIFVFSLLFPKGVILHLNKFESHFTKACFLPSLVDIDLVVLEKKTKMWKVYLQTVDGQ